MQNQTLTAIEGIRVGHAHNLEAPTGCTVVICPPNTVGGVDQRGGAPGTRETDLLRPMHLVQHVNGVLLTGGSAFGLNAAGGVMQYLEEQKMGFPVGVGVVPIVPGAVIFDLDLGNPTIRPDAEMGYAACLAANDSPVEEGCVGAGAGARVGMLTGTKMACKSGIGSAMIELDHGLKVAALIVVNAAGDVYDANGQILAGTRLPPDGKRFAGGMSLLKAMAALEFPPAVGVSNTVIGVVATNAQLNKEETNKIAQMAQNGLAQAIKPAHTMFDGDTIFALATGGGPRANVNAIGAFAAEVTAQAIRRAVQQATPLFDLPSGAMVAR